MKSAAYLTLVCLFAWLMPLGAFIKPSQEKTACDGRRAFHMCSMMSGEADSNKDTSSKISISNSSGFNENAKSQGSGGDEFLLIDPLKIPDLKIQNRHNRIKNPIYSFFPNPNLIPPEARPLF